MKIGRLLIIMLFTASLAEGQTFMDLIKPQPQHFYVREMYSAVFSPTGQTIYLSADNPQWEAALLLNEGMKERGLDTLPIAFWDTDNLYPGGIVIGLKDSYLEKVLNNVPDEPITINDKFPPPEGYIIDIVPFQMLLIGGDERGLIYGVSSFFQMLDGLGANNYIFASRVVDGPQYPVRWVYYPTNVLVGANTTKSKELWSQCSSLKLNGINMTDYKFSFISDMPERYFDSLKSLRDFAADKHLDIIPGIFPFGYSSGMLYFNPNLASGLPVYGQRFVIEGDTGRLVPHTDVSLKNGGFEQYNGNNAPGFSWYDSPGTKSFIDTDIKHSGSASLRFNIDPAKYPDDANYRINIRIPVKPFSYYHVSAWVRTQGHNGDGPRITVLNKGGKSINFATPPIGSNSDWKKLEICFNSLETDTALVYWGTWGGRSGQVWWDDLQIEEVPFVNMIRREGAPLNVSHQILDIAYIEGRDYDTLRDPKTGYLNTWAGNYDTYHTPPTFKIKAGGNIHNGDTLLISYYHAITIYDGQVMITMSEPEVYENCEREFRILDSILKPECYFMNHDEIRTMNWDAGDQARGMSPGELLADNVNKCIDIIHKYNPGADVWDWSDMFDEYHNAVPSDYYLVNGDLRGSADIISNNMGIVNWNTGRNQDKSLSFFSGKGFRQIAAPYYDTDENHIRRWKENARGTENFMGMMYTTWANDYSYLEPFAQYSWNHAPHIYHYPPWQYQMRDTVGLFFNVVGDKYDEQWELVSGEFYYRLDKSGDFIEMPLEPVNGKEFFVQLILDQKPKLIEYYMTATDNRGWTKKMPYGDGQYYELRDYEVGVEGGNSEPGLEINDIRREGHRLILSLRTGSGIQICSTMSDILGRKIIPDVRVISGFETCQAELDISGLNEGCYFIIISNGREIRTAKYILTK